MITKVVHGWRPAGLIAYLMGPGRHEEHRDPRVVASWDGAPRWHQPAKLPGVVVDGEVLEPGEFDFDLRRLIATMQEWPKIAGLPMDNPPPEPTPQRPIGPASGAVAAPGTPGASPPGEQGPAEDEVARWSAWLRTAGRRRPPEDAPSWVRFYRWDPKAGRIRLRPGYVWHCSVALHADDPVLSDAQWEHIAQRLMEATGIHQAGCRWIAVRHADNHIHLCATLVSETTGRRFYAHNDYPKLRVAAAQLEKEFGLVRTAEMDKTACRTPTRQEIGKTTRTGRTEPARVELRRVVSKLAATSDTATEFLAALRAEGVIVHLQRSADGEVRGYAVGLATDRTAGGAPVLYAGGKLATDLTWPKLLARWASTPHRDHGELPRTATGQPTPAARRTVLTEVAAVVDHAAAELRSGNESGDGIIHATADILAALTAAAEPHRRGPLGTVLDHYDRCARTPHTVLPPSLGPLARDLRWAARHLARVGMLSGRGNERYATATLLLALTALIAEIGAWHELRGRHHQAAAAHRAAAALPVPTTRPTRTTTSTARSSPHRPGGPVTATRVRTPTPAPAAQPNRTR